MAAKKATRRVMTAMKAALAEVPEPEVVTHPNPAEVPDWSDATLKLFGPLTVLERAFVEHFVAGGNAAEAYRRATRTEYEDRDTDTTRKNGYAIHARPRVRAAIAAAMKDRNFNARSDLEWKIQKLRLAIAKCEKFDDAKAQATMGNLVETLARLQGELQPKADDDGGTERGGVRIRILEILADADRLVRTPAQGAGGPGGRPDRPPARPAVGADQRPPGNGLPQ